jgi:ubiquinone/menaquinone biosynthesis C-methylase UbiE
VTLYSGELPLPFPHKRFGSAVCTEVLEHVADYQSLLAEIARVCKGTVVVTVPDMSAIPTCCPHFVVPWHLLEGTHVNFFNQTSLGKLLRRHFASVELAKIGPFDVNGTRLFTSVMAICTP